MCTLFRQMPACLLVLLGHATSDGRPVSMPDGRGGAVRSEWVAVLGTSKAFRSQFNIKRAVPVLFHTLFIYFFSVGPFVFFLSPLGLSSFCCLLFHWPWLSLEHDWALTMTEPSAWLSLDHDWALTMTCTWIHGAVQVYSSHPHTLRRQTFRRPAAFYPV